MSKAPRTLTPEVLEGATSAPEVDNTPWLREQALNAAMQFHKTNGGMMHPQQVVENAQIFLTFLKG